MHCRMILDVLASAESLSPPWPLWGAAGQSSSEETGWGVLCTHMAAWLGTLAALLEAVLCYS